MSCVSRLNLCPASGDTENVLLQKILQSLNAGGGSSGGGGITSVNGDSGPVVLLDSGEIPEGSNLYFTDARAIASTLTGFVAGAGTVTAADSILTALQKSAGVTNDLLNFRDTNAHADASIYINSGATEIIKVVGSNAQIQVATTRIHRDVSNSTLSIMSGISNTDGSFTEYRSDSVATPGAITHVTKGTGDYSIKTAPLASGAATSLWVMSSVGNVTHTPTWNSGATTFIGYRINATDTASAAATKLADFQVATVSQWNVTKAGQSTQLGSANVNSGTITADDPGFDLTQTWNAPGVMFMGIRVNITDTASAASSSLIDLQVGGSSKFSVLKTGQTVAYETADATITNYSRTSITPQGGNHLIRTENGGTGTLRILQVGTGPSTGTNIAGVNTIIHSGQPTGSGVPGAILFQQGLPVGGSGSGVTALATSWQITTAGSLTSTIGSITVATLSATGFNMTSRFAITGGGANGVMNLLDWDTGGSLNRLNFGPATNSNFAIGRDAVNGLTLQSAAGTATYNDASTAASGTVANRYLFGLAAPTLSSTNATVTYTVASSVFIGGAPTAGTNVTIGTAVALNVAAGTTLLANLTQRVGALYSVTSGANQRAGNAVLVAGTVTVSNTTTTANTIVLLTRKTSGGTIGLAITYTVSAGASFTITSDSAIDTSTFSYFLIEVP